ncbi:prolyl oligopeptidase family serine peptidase [Agrococcus sp. SCSIO52902]|uniref:prolyl oligopeptidase family serine peptidase n=1 Tax=Agrococcus sp. SCSIO52902 TaxID=2933290 RepID=UPI001FF40DE5|nr:prolyl oligopeptidase family serine peptidase [Agrococcus sp. SCSIO52902]UOV99939.1 prolyl oligopeptidase family serine peptidase [Agrococcus sp. SCSIO52902]
MRYPEVKRDSTVEQVHGEAIADPYRWLEDGDSAETRAFIEAQNAFAEPILAALPARGAFRALLTGLLEAPTRGCPWIRGGRAFAWHSDGQNQPVLITADSVDELEGGRVLLDPNALSDDGTVAVTVASVSPDGALLAYGLADGGSDWRTIRVRDVATGEDLGDEIPWSKWNSPVWLPGDRAFSYWAYDAPTGDALTEEMGAGRLMRHEIGADVADDAILFSRPDEARLFARHWPRHDEWFVLSTDTGSSSGNDLAARRHGDEALRQLVTGNEHEWNAIGVRDGRLFAVTDEGAPRYRLAAFDLTTGEQRAVVPEHPEDVLLDAALTASGLVLEYSHDASHRMQLATLDGELGDHVPLGEGVSITGSETSATSDRVLVSTSSFVDRGTRHVVETHGARLVAHRTLPTPGPAAPAATTTRVRTASSDGATVPAFLVRPEGDAGDAPRPTLIWGYGGFNIPMNPGFRAVLAAWVAAGGVLVVPNLRGGGEFGSEWHKGGTKERKQQVFDDLYAIAEHLVATGVTSPEQLALHGRSNGGLLAGAALTQRPELWAAVLPGVGVLDMLRYHRFTIGWAWASDYGDPDEPQAHPYLRAYSPLHNVREGVAHPPTLITTGDHDDRVVPAHSFKFAAELQRAQQASGSDAPVLLSVDTRAGHGMGKPKDAAALEFADQLAFAAHHTGLGVQELDAPGLDARGLEVPGREVDDSRAAGA